MSAFKASRSDGRSDGKVVYDLVHGAAPDTIFTHAQILQALAEGLDVAPTQNRLYRAVAAGCRRLLREDKRALMVVRGSGYKVARADEHMPMAVDRKVRARHQMRAGVNLLRYTSVDELSEAQLRLHQGMALVMQGVMTTIDGIEKEQGRMRKVVENYGERLASIEHQIAQPPVLKVAQ